MTVANEFTAAAVLTRINGANPATAYIEATFSSPPVGTLMLAVFCTAPNADIADFTITSGWAALASDFEDNDTWLQTQQVYWKVSDGTETAFRVTRTAGINFMQESMLAVAGWSGVTLGGLAMTDQETIANDQSSITFFDFNPVDDETYLAVQWLQHDNFGAAPSLETIDWNDNAEGPWTECMNFYQASIWHRNVTPADVSARFAMAWQVGTGTDALPGSTVDLTYNTPFETNGITWGSMEAYSAGVVRPAPDAPQPGARYEPKTRRVRAQELPHSINSRMFDK